MRATDTRRRCFPASVRNGSVHAIAFSPDGRYVAFASETRSVMLWDTRTGKQARMFQGHRAQVRGLAFRPDSRVLASCASDSTIFLWDIPEAEREVKRLTDE